MSEWCSWLLVGRWEGLFTQVFLITLCLTSFHFFLSLNDVITSYSMIWPRPAGLSPTILDSWSDYFWNTDGLDNWSELWSGTVDNRSTGNHGSRSYRLLEIARFSHRLRAHYHRQEKILPPGGIRWDYFLGLCPSDIYPIIRCAIGSIVQELCESPSGRPELAVLTSLLVSVDAKLCWTTLRYWSQLVPNMSTDIWGH